MNNKKITDSVTIGILFGRVPANEELRPSGWTDQVEDIIDIARSANAMLCLHAEDGAGKTTFLRQLTAKANDKLDTIIINPASPSLAPGWISNAIAQWMTSDPASSKNIQHKLSALRDSNRPILICLDVGDLLASNQVSIESSAILNLADASGLKLSILVCCSTQKAQSLITDTATVNRIIYNKPLAHFSENELIELAQKKLNKVTLNATRPDQKELSTLAKAAAGSPIRMIRLLCRQLGLDVPTNQEKSNTAQKPMPGKRSKKPSEDTIMPLDDLLAPPTK